MQPYIRITCKVSDFLPLEAIKEFQGNFKKRTQKEIDQIIKSILLIFCNAIVSPFIMVSSYSKLTAGYFILQGETSGITRKWLLNGY